MTLEPVQITENQIYYRTDHHWTTLGAYYAYRAWAEATGHTAPEESDYVIEAAATGFLGTTYSRVGYAKKADDIEIWSRCEGEPAVHLTGDNDLDQEGLYVRSFLDQKDKYSVFLGGNHAVTVLDMSAASSLESSDSGINHGTDGDSNIAETAEPESANADSSGTSEPIADSDSQDNTDHTGSSCEPGKTLLIIKDSYAHCFVPFLTSDYDRIVMADLRYLKEPVSSLEEEYGVTDVLILYNAVHFTEANLLMLVQ